MGAAASAGGLREKVEHIMEKDDHTDEDIRSVISDLPPDIRKKVKRVLLHFDDAIDFYDPANLNGSLCESILKHQIENHGKLPLDQEAIQEDMRKAREFYKRPVSLPAIQALGASGMGADGSGVDDPAESLYSPPPEAFPEYDKGVPKGDIIHVDGFRGGKAGDGSDAFYPGVQRDVKIYVPAQLNPDLEPSLILFNDGDGFFKDTPACKILDSLIHSNSIPVTVAIFLGNSLPVDSPKYEEVEKNGGSEDEKLKVLLTNELGRKIEYDSCTESFPNFVQNEVLPFVLQKIRDSEQCPNLKDFKGFSQDPAQRCVVGVSSSGMAAFNMAWHTPHLWGRVLSHSGAFVGLNGGHNYPVVVRRTSRKGRENLRIVLTSGSNDNVDDMYGSFALANHTMADALRCAGYDYKYDFGRGGHNLEYGGSMMAEHLKWLLGGGGQ